MKFADSVAILKLACFIATDGGIYPKRNQVYFNSTDRKIVEEFIEVARHVGTNKVFVNRGHKCLQAYFYSKKICKEILKLIGRSKTLPLSKINNLKNKDRTEILRILFSTDGGVSFSTSRSKSDGKFRLHRKVTFTSKNFKNLVVVKKLLKELRIESKIHENELEIKGYKNLLRFKKLIGFLKGAKVTNKSKKWRGMDKNQLLNVVINSYRDMRRE